MADIRHTRWAVGTGMVGMGRERTEKKGMKPSGLNSSRFKNVSSGKGNERRGGEMKGNEGNVTVRKQGICNFF